MTNLEGKDFKTTILKNLKKKKNLKEDMANDKQMI